ncbi:unnamed protein product [Cunninghamella blakesleeana]
MDYLPSEILCDIFNQLPQRSAALHCAVVCKKWHDVILQPSFYSTINIYSIQQYNKLSLLAALCNLNINNNINIKPIGHYVKHLVFHIHCLLIEEQIVDFKPFPNVQSIRGLKVDDLIGEGVKLAYLQLRRPIHISYWYIDEEWIAKFNKVKDHLKSLDIHITPALLTFTPSPQQIEQSSPPIHITETLLRSFDDHISVIELKLPTLVHLTELKIHFRQLIYTSEQQHSIDDITLETIHQSCPHLETLYLDKFFMGISQKFHDDPSFVLPANRLKHLHLKGQITRPLCYYYFYHKYPHLESLSLFLCYANISIDSIGLFQGCIYSMLLNLNSLKSISVDFFHTQSSTISTATAAAVNTVGNATEKVSFWPHFGFLKCLYERSHQMEHLDYPFNVTINEKEKNAIIVSEANSTNSDPINKFLLKQYSPPILDHLTSLSLRLTHAVKLVFNYILNKNNDTTMVLSTRLKELKISQPHSTSNRSLYIDDWFIIFPNLNIFKLCDLPNVTDEDDGSDEDDEDDDDDVDHYHHHGENKRMNSTLLHQLIKQRKQSQSFQYSSFYKLECLEIENSRIHFKNGYNDFFKKCPQLKNLKMKKMKHATSKKEILQFEQQQSSTMHSDKKHPLITLDLSHLFLESLYIYQLTHTIRTDDDPYGFTVYPTTQLKLYESSSNQIRSVMKSIKIKSYLNATLYIKCKRIDGLVFI